MKTHTKAFYGALFALLVMTVPFAAQARPYDQMGGPGYGWHQSLPPEQRDAVGKLMREHMAAMQPLRDQLWTKSRTLRALENNPKVEPKEIRTLVEEVAGLRGQLRDKHMAFADKVKKETGVDVPFNCGMRGDGYGRHRGGGYGPGYGPGYGQGQGGGYWHKGGNHHGGMDRW